MQNPSPEQAVIRQLVSWGSAQESVRALVLTSSRAVPHAPVDALSDYDVIVAVTDLRPYFESRTWLGDFGPVLVVYRDPIRTQEGFERFAYITQYETGLKIDFGVCEVGLLRHYASAPDLPIEFDAGYRVLLDKDHLTEGLKPPSFRGYIPTPPTEAEFQTRVELFFHEATYVAKYLWRDDLMAAQHIFETGMRQDNLRVMIEWRSEIDHGWQVKPGPYGRRLKRWISPDLWASLEQTYARMDINALWNAFWKAVALFRQVAMEVGQQLGFTYPHDLDQRAIAYLQKVHNLDQDPLP